MSATEALKEARAAGIHVNIDGDDLVLEAPAKPRPGQRFRAWAAVSAPASGVRGTGRNALCDPLAGSFEAASELFAVDRSGQDDAPKRAGGACV